MPGDRLRCPEVVKGSAQHASPEIGMDVMNRRSRVVWFRLTPEEYEAARAFCIASGMRSISDLSRSAVTHFIAADAARKQEPLSGEMQRLRAKIQQLTKRMEELSQLLQVQQQPLKEAAQHR